MHCNSKSTRFQKLHLRGRTLTYVHYFHNEWPQRQLPQRLNCSPPAGTIAFPPHFCNIPPPHPPPHPPIAAPVPRAEPPLYPRSPPGAIAALHPAAPLHALLPAKVTHLMGGGGDRWKNDLSPGTRTILSHGNIGIYLIPGNSARVSPFISSPEFCKSFISFCAANQLRFSCTVPILHAHHTAANASAPPHPLPVLTVQKAERAP